MKTKPPPAPMLFSALSVKNLSPNGISVKSVCVAQLFDRNQGSKYKFLRATKLSGARTQMISDRLPEAGSRRGMARLLEELESRECAMKASELAKLLGVTRQQIYKLAAAR